MRLARLPSAGTGRVLAAAVLLLGAASLAACAYEPASPSRSGPPRYYVSPDGSDAAAGTSPATAWRTLARASAAVLTPGTRLLLKGGATFTGGLTLTSADAGNAGRPVMIGSYGTGRAVIATTSGNGIAVTDTAGVDIRGLVLRGSAAARGSGSGINVFSDRLSGGKFRHIFLSEVAASGFAYGISVGTDNVGTGFSDVSVSDSALHDNLYAGLVSYGPAFSAAAPAYATEDVRVTRVTAYHNMGTPLQKVYSTGNGILLGSVRHASVTWSKAFDNGGLGGSQVGPEGIWAFASTGVVIAHDVSYANKTRTKLDGNGFGLDENTSDSVLEYDLSYDNDGAGYLLFSKAADGSGSGNTVRYSISSADSRDGSGKLGGITVYGTEQNADVYQNTVVMGSPPRQFALVLGPAVRHVTVRNNILANRAGPVLVAHRRSTAKTFRLQGNDYYSFSSPLSFIWGTTTYGTLPAWRAATGQEELAGRRTGHTVNPRLHGPLTGLPERPGPGRGLGARFIPVPGSAVAGAGLDLSRLFGLYPGPVNFAGVPVRGPQPDIGAE